MDNVTLFKRIFADRDRFAKPFRTYLDHDAKFPKLSCTKEDLKRYSFNKESLKESQNLLCVCEPIRPEISKSAYECLKRNENDSHALGKCEKEVNALNSVVKGVINELKESNQRAEQIRYACPDTFKEFISKQTDESAAKFHACFVPIFCTNQLKKALNCVNKNHEELHGCENEIDEMIKCSIDKWTQHVFKISSLSARNSNKQNNTNTDTNNNTVMQHHELSAAESDKPDELSASEVSALVELLTRRRSDTSRSNVRAGSAGSLHLGHARQADEIYDKIDQCLKFVNSPKQPDRL